MREKRLNGRSAFRHDYQALILGIILLLFTIPSITFASTWDIQTVDSAGSVGEYTSIALDSNNYPHISYHNSAYWDLKYARWNGVSWDIQTVDSAGEVGAWSSIALDNST